MWDGWRWRLREDERENYLKGSQAKQKLDRHLHNGPVLDRVAHVVHPRVVAGVQHRGPHHIPPAAQPNVKIRHTLQSVLGDSRSQS